MGDYINALRIQREITLIQDTLFRETRTRQLAELETKYKTAEQERQLAFQAERIEQEESEKELIAWGAGIAILFLLIIFGLAYVRYRLKQQVRMEQAVAKERKEGFIAVLDAVATSRTGWAVGATTIYVGLITILNAVTTSYPSTTWARSTTINSCFITILNPVAAGSCTILNFCQKVSTILGIEP